VNAVPIQHTAKDKNMENVTELGTITHHYWFEGDDYYRVPLIGGFEQFWNGATWVNTTVLTASNFKLAA